MTTKAKHAKRSRRNHTFYFVSEDRAFHEVDKFGRIIIKEHPKKYDGNGNRINIEE